MIHPAFRSLISRYGPVCFGDFAAGQATPKPADDLTVDRTVRAVLDFVNRFAPPNRQFKTMEQLAADHSLFAATLDGAAASTARKGFARKPVQFRAQKG